MCGLVGMAGDLHHQHAGVFKTLLVLDQLRGDDSTGVVFVPIGLNLLPTIEKEVGGPSNLWGWGLSGLFNMSGKLEKTGMAYLGHNRFATVGVVNDETAHPFNFGQVYGMHNGTLRSYEDIKHGEDFDIDSQYLINSIDKVGIEETWKGFTGAAAVVWWDDSDGTLHFARNSERPLHLATSRKGKALLWASERWMIEVAMARAKEEIDKDSHFELPVNQHLSYKVTSASATLEKEERLEPKYFFPKKENTQIGGGRGQCYRKGTFTKYTKPDIEECNKGWAQEFAKADKNMRESKIKINNLDYLLPSRVLPEHQKRYALGVMKEIVGNPVIRVYPANLVEADTLWKNGLGTKYKLKARPRIIMKNATFLAYGIAANHLLRIVDKVAELPSLPPVKKEEPLRVRGPDNCLLTLAEWNESINQLEERGCCSCCNNPLDIKDSSKIGWVNPRIAVCPDCMGEGGLLETLGIGLENVRFLH